MRTTFLVRAILCVLAAMALVIGFSSTTALALTRGTASESPAVDEDNDHNDGGTPNNVVDDGDNAHPSGRDRSDEARGSGTQGAAQSDPDDDGRGPERSNGGVDQPDGAGGIDKADQDGNNGCGNDDDFEDDNEGWCGHKPLPSRTHQVTTNDKAGESSSVVSNSNPCDSIASMDADVAACVMRPFAAVKPEVAEVLGIALIARAAQLAAGLPTREVHVASADEAAVAATAAELPFTGLDAMTLAALALSSLVIGGAFVRMSRGRRTSATAAEPG